MLKSNRQCHKKGDEQGIEPGRSNQMYESRKSRMTASWWPYVRWEQSAHKKRDYHYAYQNIGGYEKTRAMEVAPQADQNNEKRRR